MSEDYPPSYPTLSDTPHEQKQFIDMDIVEAVVKNAINKEQQLNTMINTMTKAMAIIIAEHEVMRTCLIEHGLIEDGLPMKWAVGPLAGEPIVNIEKAIAEFMKEREKKKEELEFLDELKRSSF